MATNGTQQTGGKKMDFKPVDFDVKEIAPDAPAGKWMASIPRGKVKIQPTKEEKFPMLIIPLRLDGTDEEGENYQKALGTELAVMVVFFDNSKPRAARMSKLRIRQLCEAADVDLDIVPTKVESEEDFAEFITALEGKKFAIWTRLIPRKDTGEIVVDVAFQEPGGLNLKGGEDDEDEEDEEPAPRGRKTTAAPAKKSARR